MSLYPCDLHGRRVPGALNGFYPAILRGSDRYGRRMRLCTVDLDRLFDEYAGEWIVVDDDQGLLDTAVCAHCGADFGGAAPAAAFFATSYRKKSDRQDFFAAYCFPCSDRVITNLGLAL